MSKTPLSSLTVLVAAALSACAVPDHGEPPKPGIASTPASLIWRLTSARSDTTQGLKVRLAVAWYPVTDGAVRSYRPAQVTTLPGVYDTSVDSSFELALPDAPPASAQSEVVRYGQTKHASRGILIAYVDSNGNGELDTSTTDRIVAASVGTVDQIAMVSWEEDTAYTLIADDGSHAWLGTKSLATLIDLRVSDNGELNWLNCESCDLAPRKRVIGKLEKSNDDSSAEIAIVDARLPLDWRANASSAEVQVNGEALTFNPAAGYHFALSPLMFGAATPVEVKLGGAETIHVETKIPAAVKLVTAQPNADGSMNVTWEGGESAAEFQVMLAQGATVRFEGRTTNRTITVPAASRLGAMTLTVRAYAAPDADSADRAAIVGIASDSKPVRFE